MRRIGYEPQRVTLERGVRELSVSLERLPATLPEVSIAAARVCFNTESATARAKWELARRLYNDTSTAGRGSDLQHYWGETVAESLGTVDPSALTGGLRGTNSTALRGYRRDVEREGYVWALEGKHHSWDYGIWRYPLFEADNAQHFAERFSDATTRSPSAETILTELCCGSVREIAAGAGSKERCVSTRPAPSSARGGSFGIHDTTRSPLEAKWYRAALGGYRFGCIALGQWTVRAATAFGCGTNLCQMLRIHDTHHVMSENPDGIKSMVGRPT